MSVRRARRDPRHARQHLPKRQPQPRVHTYDPHVQPHVGAGEGAARGDRAVAPHAAAAAACMEEERVCATRACASQPKLHARLERRQRRRANGRCRR
eukprot:131936-Chlamydomonas_euryale.AAC.1